MSQCEHSHLAHYKHFCLYCKFKFYYPKILRVVGGADTPKKSYSSSAEFAGTYYTIIINFSVLLQIHILLSSYFEGGTDTPKIKPPNPT